MKEGTRVQIVKIHRKSAWYDERESLVGVVCRVGSDVERDRDHRTYSGTLYPETDVLGDREQFNIYRGTLKKV